MNAQGAAAPLVLLVEDEAHLAEVVLFNLRVEGYRTHYAADGETALEYLAGSNPDAILLDVMLPGIEGFEVARQLRLAGNFTPILMLTARGRAEDVLAGFEAGADDYLSKPFELSILLARLNGLLRRMQWQRSQSPPAAEPETAAPEPAPRHLFRFGDREIHFDSLELSSPGQQVRLTLMEAELLRYLIERPGKVVSRGEILEEVWRVREDTDTRAIDNFVVRLRRYLEPDPSRPVHLLTVRGVGYRFVGEGTWT
ncbi:response regulator transcription factor [Terriglobus aquaticus]|uniref:Response regulator transcription factor n=1 Tax=Terriglobus aquaticus TaxID=940139 RepID=A0ABW9KKJ4_9BACT|nr:response regulator transcription factor [Terriglobus aquaticus]